MKHIRILDPMRGIAALGVVMFHYAGSMLPSITPNLLTEALVPAKYGVQVFFVISGFIIPYAMHRSSYTWSAFGGFMARRFVRIAPPAYWAALLMILFHGSALLITGKPVDSEDWPGVNLRSVIGNLVFHPMLLGTKWYNFAFWTLMLEFQFYILIGLLLPFLLDAAKWPRTMLIILAMLALNLVDPQWYFAYSPYFTLGLLVFLLQNGFVTRSVFAVLVVVACAVCLVQGAWVPLLFSLVATGVIMARIDRGTKATDLLGTISYSLYITHVPVGYFAESAIKRVIDLHHYPAGKLVLLFFYTAVALVAAWLFYRVVEVPFLERSKRIGRKLLTGARERATT